jgi:membrane peptidoglycan carboxypeptidase
MGMAGYYISTSQDFPSLKTLPLLLEPPDGLLLQPTRFFDRSGEYVIHTLQNPASSERRYIPMQDKENLQIEVFLSPALITTTIAISDPTFWSNPGFSTQGIHENKHNTIAQKLVVDLLLWEEQPSVSLALRERLLAAQITDHFGREKILEWYLNSAYYGNLAYGAEAAAQIYFGKSASELNLAEAAVLAAVAEAPALNPLDAPKTAIERQLIVINAMMGQELISEEEALKAKNTNLKFRDTYKPRAELAPAYIEYVWDQLTKIIPGERLERGGFEIITTLDFDLQVQASCTTAIHRSRITGENPDTSSTEGQLCDAALLLPTLTLEENLSLDSINANVIVLEPSSGQILAMVGGPNPRPIAAYSTYHPAGTLLTPYI